MSATRKEEGWLNALQEAGCVVCRLFHGGIFSPPEIHHLKIGGRRVVTEESPHGHLSSVPICPRHHRSGVNCKQYVSRHPHSDAFAQRYGTDEHLLERVRGMVAGLHGGSGDYPDEPAYDQSYTVQSAFEKGEAL